MNCPSCGHPEHYGECPHMDLVPGGNGSCPDARRCECGVVRLDSGRRCDGHDDLAAAVHRLADLLVNYHAEVVGWREENAGLARRVEAIEHGERITPAPTGG